MKTLNAITFYIVFILVGITFGSIIFIFIYLKYAIIHIIEMIKDKKFVKEFEESELKWKDILYYPIDIYEQIESLFK